MGGLVPLGYGVCERQLIIIEAEAATVRNIFTRYTELGSVRLLKEELDRDGIRSKVRVSKDGAESGGQAFSRGALYTLLRNPIYVGQIRHKDVCHPGQHAPIVDRALWDKVAQLLREHSTGCGHRSSSTKSGVLIGKLFDESGQGLTPSHAVKGDRRYRYYVSRSLMKGPAARVDGGWRLPAAEIERSIAAAARSILDDQQTVVGAIEEAALGSGRIAPLLKSAAAWSERLQFEPDNALSALIDRVDLDQEGVRLSLKLPLPNAASGAPDGAGHLSINRRVPMQIRRRGVELRLIINGGANASCTTDQALLRAVARAHCWFDDLVSGRCGSMVEIARRDGVGKQYISRLMRLAFLAPEMVERIVAGRHRLSLPRRYYGPAVSIFRWNGRRKSEPSDLRSRSEHAPINRGPATTLLLFKVKRQVQLQAKSTAQSANREKSSRLAVNFNDSSSPVDLECEIRAECALFTQRSRRIPKTEDSLAEGVEFELSVDFVNGQ